MRRRHRRAAQALQGPADPGDDPVRGAATTRSTAGRKEWACRSRPTAARLRTEARAATDRRPRASSYLTPTLGRVQERRSPRWRTAATRREGRRKPDRSAVCAAPPPGVARGGREGAGAAPQADAAPAAGGRGQGPRVLPEDWPEGPLPQWVRLLANFPRERQEPDRRPAQRPRRRATSRRCSRPR